MKELYTSPEVKLINFLAQERLAATDEEITFTESTVDVDPGDITLDLDFSL